MMIVLGNFGMKFADTTLNTRHFSGDETEAKTASVAKHATKPISYVLVYNIWHDQMVELRAPKLPFDSGDESVVGKERARADFRECFVK